MLTKQQAIKQLNWNEEQLRRVAHPMREMELQLHRTIIKDCIIELNEKETRKMKHLVKLLTVLVVLLSCLYADASDRIPMSLDVSKQVEPLPKQVSKRELHAVYLAVKNSLRYQVLKTNADKLSVNNKQGATK